MPANLKVAKILSVEDHPDADKLYVIKVYLGLEQRQLVAGIKESYSKEELVGRNIVVVSNLKPAKLRGVESQGMLLAASDKEATRLLSVEKSSPGDQVKVDGVDATQEQITIDIFSKLKFSIKDKKALYDGRVLKTDSEEVTADISDKAKIR